MQLQSPFALVTPTLDGEVLTVLARVDSRLTAGQIHTVLPHRSQEGIRKALIRLNAQGVVHSERISGIIAHRLNRRHLAAPHIIAIANLRDTVMTQMREQLESWLTPPTWAALFGSAARGDMRTDSDIDILLIDPGTDADLWESATGVFAADVTAWTGNDARTLTFTEDEIRLGAVKRDPIIESLLADAITISGPMDWLRRTVRSARR